MIELMMLEIIAAQIVMSICWGIVILQTLNMESQGGSGALTVNSAYSRLKV